MPPGEEPDPQRRRESSRESVRSMRNVRMRFRSPSPATHKKKGSNSTPYWLAALLFAMLLPPRPNVPLGKDWSPLHFDGNFSISRMDSQSQIMFDRFDCDTDMFCTPDYSDEHFFDAFKNMRPMGLRWRDDDNFWKVNPPPTHKTSSKSGKSEVTVMPVLTEQRPMIDHHTRRPIAGISSANMLPTSSRHMNDEPSLEDIELIDVLWRSDITHDKGGPAEQCERDLQTLTEKSSVPTRPLTHDDSSSASSLSDEQASKTYFEDFYGPSGPLSACSPRQATPFAKEASYLCEPSVSCAEPEQQRFVAQRSNSPVVQQHAKSNLPTPTDAELDALFADVWQEVGQLNADTNETVPTTATSVAGTSYTQSQVTTSESPSTAHTFSNSSETVVDDMAPLGLLPQAHPVMANVSLGVPPTAANLTEIDIMMGRNMSMLPHTAVLNNTSVDAAAMNGMPNIMPYYPGNTFNQTNHFWYNHSADGALSCYLRRDGISNMTMAVEQMPQQAPTITEIGVLPAYGQQQQLMQRGQGHQHHNARTQTSLMPPVSNAGSAAAGFYDPYNNERRSMSMSNESSVCSSISSSSTSPRYGSETENHSPAQTTRFYGKLIPNPRDEEENRRLYFADNKDVLRGISAAPFVPGTPAPRRRGRQSKDEQLAANYGLPVSAAEIADMSLPELQKMLRSENLTDEQKTLIRKIRRRGKNKVAARTCRMRRGEVRTTQPSGPEQIQWIEAQRTIFRRQ